MRETNRERFESVHIDIEKGIYEINGEKIPDRCCELLLEFDNGEWSLMVTTSKLYGNSDQMIKE